MHKARKTLVAIRFNIERKKLYTILKRIFSEYVSFVSHIGKHEMMIDVYSNINPIENVDRMLTRIVQLPFKSPKMLSFLCSFFNVNYSKHFEMIKIEHHTNYIGTAPAGLNMCHIDLKHSICLYEQLFSSCVLQLWSIRMHH